MGISHSEKAQIDESKSIAPPRIVVLEVHQVYWDGDGRLTESDEYVTVPVEDIL